MTRVVLDVNVLISAIISPHGAPTAIVDSWRRGEVEVVVSDHLLAELAGVLRRPRLRRWISEDDGDALVFSLRRRGLFHDDVVDPPAIAPDSDDNYLIALSLTSQADMLVTGDTELREVDVPGLTILTPREFVGRFVPPPPPDPAS